MGFNTLNTAGKPTIGKLSNWRNGSPIAIPSGDGFTDSTLLLHFDAAPPVDSSANALTVSLQGSSSISTALPKFGVSSLLLPGNSSSFARVNDSVTIELGSSDFTIEFWANFSALGYVLGKGNATTAVGSAISWLLSSNNCQFYAGGTAYTLSTPAPTLNVYTHLAITRSGSTLRYFRGGTQSGTTTIAGSINNVTQALQIGGYAASGCAGYIDEFIIDVGVARYTANFTPPTVPRVS